MLQMIVVSMNDLVYNLKTDFYLDWAIQPEL